MAELGRRHAGRSHVRAPKLSDLSEPGKRAIWGCLRSLYEKVVVLLLEELLQEIAEAGSLACRARRAYRTLVVEIARHRIDRYIATSLDCTRCLVRD